MPATLTTDHFLLGSADLDAGIRFLREKTGVEAMEGGNHPGAGTHNALVSLEADAYLEIISPDPQATFLEETYRLLPGLTEPTLFFWAVRTTDIVRSQVAVQHAGFQTSAIRPGSRTQKDGGLLEWRTFRVNSRFPGLVPFFIEWSATARHPSVDAPKGCVVDRFEIFTPDPVEVSQVMKALKIDVRVSSADKNRLSLVLQTPRGLVSL